MSGSILPVRSGVHAPVLVALFLLNSLPRRRLHNAAGLLPQHRRHRDHMN
ncbi:hypothetical protein [Streptomyces sp. NPDC056308]